MQSSVFVVYVKVGQQQAGQALESEFGNMQRKWPLAALTASSLH